MGHFRLLAPSTNQTFSRSNKNSGAMAAQSEATFTNNSNPQPELSARLDGLGSKAQEGPPEHQHDAGRPGHQKSGTVKNFKRSILYKKNELTSIR